LQAFGEAAPDRHYFTDRLHRRAQGGLGPAEFLESEARHLGDDIIDRRLEARRRRAATLAIGKPVAFEASAELRETRGFISITTIRPVFGSIANWTLEPPVSTPISRRQAMLALRIT
jgi:hypothetical protein